MSFDFKDIVYLSFEHFKDNIEDSFVSLEEILDILETLKEKVVYYDRYMENEYICKEQKEYFKNLNGWKYIEYKLKLQFTEKVYYRHCNQRKNCKK